jgi:ppGpp synthetase/RelA/SpoT-type nucleotidyltranferase
MIEQRQIEREREYLRIYEGSTGGLAKQNNDLEELISSLAGSTGLDLHVVSARVKTPQSVRNKLLRKRYANPEKQLTDTVAVRVILYHGCDVDAVVTKLRTHLKVIKKHSSDKRTALGLREFGYRSYHLLAEINPDSPHYRDFPSLMGVRFEVQVRSLLEHAWAEIEHESVYKADADLPDEIRRRFAAVAAVLELLDAEFTTLKTASTRLIEAALPVCMKAEARRLPLDLPYLLAVLETARPHGRSFRAAAQAGEPFPSRIESRFLLALRRLRVKTVGEWVKHLRSARLRDSVRRYAVNRGLLVDAVSHLAVLALAVGLLNRDILVTFFPELAADQALWQALPANKQSKSG